MRRRVFSAVRFWTWHASPPEGGGGKWTETRIIGPIAFTITSIPFTDLSLTGLARDVTGAGDVVNTCSGAYTAGKWTGRAWEVGMTAAVAWRGIQPGGWMNSNRYLRVGFGRNEGFKWFRLAGKLVKNGHLDIFKVGPW